jgi:hypothetical protein
VKRRGGGQRVRRLINRRRPGARRVPNEVTWPHFQVDLTSVSLPIDTLDG